MAEFLRSSSWNLSCVAINCSRRSKVVADGSPTTQKGAFDNCSTFKVTSISGNILLSIHLRTCYRRSRRVPIPSTVKRIDGRAVSIFAEISCNTSTILLWSCQQTTAMGGTAVHPVLSHCCHEPPYTYSSHSAMILVETPR